MKSSAFLVSFALFDRESYLTLAASLIGVTSLIYNAKGNPFGQAAGREYENIPCRMTEDEKAHYITPRKPLPMISVVLVMRVKECGSTSRAYWRRRMA